MNKPEKKRPTDPAFGSFQTNHVRPRTLVPEKNVSSDLRTYIHRKNQQYAAPAKDQATTPTGLRCEVTANKKLAYVMTTNTENRLNWRASTIRFAGLIIEDTQLLSLIPV
jgi:hypothetical protein